MKSMYFISDTERGGPFTDTVRKATYHFGCGPKCLEKYTPILKVLHDCGSWNLPDPQPDCLGLSLVCLLTIHRPPPCLA